MISYDNVRMWTVHTKTHGYDIKNQKHKELKKPIVTEKVHVSDAECYSGLGELYDMMKYAIQRDPYKKINVSFQVYEEH
tara:strand:- start:181 stop:417 length:237 start_codon:yes stop_codon:yes gene_type:complete